MGWNANPMRDFTSHARIRPPALLRRKRLPSSATCWTRSATPARSVLRSRLGPI